MEIMTDKNCLLEMEQMLHNDTYSNILGNIEILSDSHSECDWSDIGILDNIQDSMIFNWNKEFNVNTNK